MSQETYELLKQQCESGATLGDAGRRLGLTRQRVHQILKKHPDLEAKRKQVRSEIKDTKKYGELLVKRKSMYNYMTQSEFHSVALRTEQIYRLRNKRRSAMRDGHSFELEWADLHWPTHCPILGLELDYYGEAGQRSDNSVSFDRLDPSVGYVKGNVYIVSWRANRIKNDGTPEEHRRIADWMEYASVNTCTSSDS